MKITVKTLQQKSYQLEVEPSEKILDVKRKVEAQLAHPVDQQKLIFSGKILVDDKPVSEYGVKEGDFFVLMVTKKTTPTTAAAAPSSSASTSSSAASASTATPKSEPAKTTPAAPTKPASTTAVPATPVPAVSAPTGNPSGLLMGAEYETAVANLVEMGFDRPSIVAAMKAAFNNPDRAVEYLMNGIPAITEQVPSAGGAGEAEGLLGPGEYDEEEGGEDVDPESTFAALNANPQFAQLRQLIRQQPQLLEPLLQQLGQSNPQLLQLIGSNPDAFMQWLEGGEAGAPGAAGERQVVQLTAEEMEAINRLVALGFDKNRAIEAYLACDKNEELAANFLFDSMQ